MPELPSGTVTFLYTDIEGSTRVWEQFPEQAPTTIARHDEIWRDVIARNRGHIFRITGDGFCASFDDPVSAVTVATAAQQALFQTEWGPIGQLKVRCILHTGVAQVHVGDYVGAALNLAGRLLSVCHGGQTLVSHATAELVRHQLPEEADLLDLGRHRFRDIPQPEQIYQLSIAGLPSGFPPLSSADAIPDNLPVQLTSYIGREKEKGEVSRLLQDNRLVTLVGPGGTGKTRLSLEVARVVKEAFEDGVWFVQLASISDPALVNQSVASVLGVPEHASRPLLESLAAYCRRKRLLLLLDNCEHLVEACARMAAGLLQAAPEVKLMASSREGLGIPGESVYPLHPMSLPNVSEPPEMIATYESVRLFVERAAAARPGFGLTGSNAGAVAQICCRLDGIPLAIELAAARIKHLSPEQIAGRLDQSFRLLTGGSRAALPRQQTLRALIDWSYDLLSEPECILFRRLSVFHGGWTMVAAEAVCSSGLDESTQLDPYDILDLTGLLVEKSMVEADLQDEVPRYRLLETMRQYGLEKLKAAGEAVVVRDQHLAYFGELAMEVGGPILTPEQLPWIHRVEAEHDNMLAALDWASGGDSPGYFIKLTAALGPFWSTIGRASEGINWLGQALAKGEPSLEVWGRGEEAASIVKAFFYYGLLAFNQGRYQTSLQAFEKTLQLARLTGDLTFEAMSLTLMSPEYAFLGQEEEAFALAREAAALARQTGDEMIIGRSLAALGSIMLRIQHDPPAALQYLEKSVVLTRNSGDIGFLATPLLVLSQVAIESGDYEKARERAQEGITLAGEFRSWGLQDNFRTKIAEIHRLKGEYAQAVAIYRRVVPIWREFGNLGAMARCIECLAYIEIHRGKNFNGLEREQTLSRACRLMGAAEAVRQNPEAIMPPFEKAEYQREVALLRSLMDGETFAAAWSEGRAMSVEEAEDFVTNTLTYPEPLP